MKPKQRFIRAWTVSKLTWVQTRMLCFKVCANINEGIVLKVLCWLCSLSKWGVGPFKRGSHLSVHWQQSWSGELHASLIKKKLDEIQCIMALIWSRWGCGLSTVNCWSYYFYIQSISPFHQCDKFDNYYFAICTHKPNCENDKLIQARGVTWLTVEKLSKIAWKVFALWLAENIPMKYSPDSE